MSKKSYSWNKNNTNWKSGKQGPNQPSRFINFFLSWLADCSVNCDSLKRGSEHLLECLWWGGWPQARVWPTEDSWWRPLSFWPVPGWTLPLAPSSGTGWLSPRSYLPSSEPHTHYPGFPYTIPLERIGVWVEWQTMIIFWRIVALIKVWTR